MQQSVLNFQVKNALVEKGNYSESGEFVLGRFLLEKGAVLTISRQMITVVHRFNGLFTKDVLPISKIESLREWGDPDEENGHVRITSYSYYIELSFPKNGEDIPALIVEALIAQSPTIAKPLI